MWMGIHCYDVHHSVQTDMRLSFIADLNDKPLS